MEGNGHVAESVAGEERTTLTRGAPISIGVRGDLVGIDFGSDVPLSLGLDKKAAQSFAAQLWKFASMLPGDNVYEGGFFEGLGVRWLLNANSPATIRLRFFEAALNRAPRASGVITLPLSMADVVIATLQRGGADVAGEI